MNSKAPTRVLVLADTHNRLPANLSSLVEGTAEIWHLGDVCRPELIDELRAFGPPVVVVRGNCDGNFDWPLVADLTRNGLRFRLQHIPPGKSEALSCDIVLHGHTHVPRDESINGVRFLNPGCVTRPNRGAPPSVGIIEFGAAKKLSWRLATLR